jgi:hypothetical protein
MKRSIFLLSISLFFIIPFIGNCQTSGQWEILFDGTNLDKWQASDKVIAGWDIKDHILSLKANTTGKGQGRDLITKEKYDDFELEFFFKISKGANSGVKYLLNSLTDLKGKSALIGPEYQIIDDEHYPGPPESKTPEGLMGASYLLYPANNKKEYNAKDWNLGKIKVKKQKVEHWLNGKKILAYKIGSKDFNEKLGKTKYNVYPDFAKNKGYILLQDHGNVIHFKDIRIRKLK